MHLEKEMNSDELRLHSFISYWCCLSILITFPILLPDDKLDQSQLYISFMKKYVNVKKTTLC